MVGLGRVELPTSPLSGVRSNQLSYRPNWPAPSPDSSPGGSHKSSSVSKVSRTWLNVLEGYAFGDHRGKKRSGKEGLIQAPAFDCQEQAKRGVDEPPRSAVAGSRREQSAIAEGSRVPSGSLLERR
jgi:hypothetical protein